MTVHVVSSGITSTGGTVTSGDSPLADVASGTSFGLIPDDTDGSVIVATVACFVAGTHILTARGDVPVEHLVVGDLVPTDSGTTEPIVWMGTRRIDCTRHPAPDRVLPICIEAHAFGRNQPKRELLLSPDHAVYAEDVLIPVKYLVNDITVRQVEATAVSYFHVELSHHAVVLAEGMPVETYLDTGDRASFANGGAAMVLHPAFGSEYGDVTLVMEAKGYAPFRVTGPEVLRVRALLAKRAMAEVSPMHRPPRSR